MSDFHVKDNSSLHAYRTELPNIIFGLGLSSAEFHLYCLYKKIAGDGGECWMTTAHLAQEMMVSERQIRILKKTLCKSFAALGGAALITITTRYKDGTKERKTDLVEINDIWPINFQKVSTSGKKRRGGTEKNGGGVGKKTTGEEEPLEEEPNKKCIVVRPEAVPEKIVHNSNSEPKKNVPTEIEKRNLFGQTVKCSKEEYCRYCVQKDKKWTLPEIELAWEMLVRYEGPVTDWIKFLDGTLRKFYIAKLTNANQEKKKCQNSQNQNSKKQTNSESEEKKRLENSKKQTSGKDMLEPPCPNSVKTGLDWIAWVRSLTGQKNLKTS